jgi:hypothetical protein
LHRSTRQRYAALCGLMLWSLAATSAAAAVTDPNAVLGPPPPLAMPTAGASYNDPVFGTPTVRIVNGRPEYSELQAWNADMSLILVNTGEIRDANTFQLVHTIDWGWPDWGGGPRWSPVDPRVLFYLDHNNSFCSGAAIMKYTLIPGIPFTRTRELVGCFPEYTSFYVSETFEEMSDDGRYIALIGRKPANNQWGHVAESFVYDVIDKIKHRALELPINPTYGPVQGDHISVTPSGRYVTHFFGGGKERYRGTEAFDLEMNYLGKVHTGSAPHSTLHRDADGNDYLIADNASNSYFLTGQRYITKSRIPIGVVYDAAGNVDREATVSTGATVPLLATDWHFNIHVSGANRNRPGWVVVSTYRSQSGFDNGWQPFEDEVFKLHLDSSPTAPHVERVAHHRSHYIGITGRDSCPGISNYWAQPHATVSPDGTKILFGSNWGRVCDPSDPVDGFVLTLQAPSGDTTPPSPVTNLGAQ